MKAAIVHAGPRVEIKESPIPTANASQVVIKVIVSGTNPKDWKYPEWGFPPANQGDDIAGTIHAVGSSITEFKPGDRVAAFHEMNTPGCSFAEYALAWSHTTFHIPKKTTFEEASTLPLAFMTAALSLHQYLRLPLPFTPTLPSASASPTPLLIYSGASAVGAFAIKLARLSNIHPIITVAGNGIPYVHTLLDSAKGDTVIDYRLGDDAVVKGIKDAVKRTCGEQGKLKYALDAATVQSSWSNIANAMDPEGAVNFVLPDFLGKGLPVTLKSSMTYVGSVHKDKEGMAEATKAFAGKMQYEGESALGTQDFGFVWFRLLSRGLQEGWMTGHPYEVVDGGLGGLERALGDLKAGKASAKKFVIRLGETEGV